MAAWLLALALALPSTADSTASNATNEPTVSPADPIAPTSDAAAPTAASAADSSAPLAAGDSASGTAPHPVVIPSPSVLEPAPAAPSVRTVRVPTFAVPGTAASAAPTPPRHTVRIGVDTTGSGTADRSAWAAVGLTALLPGAGHRYLGYDSRSKAWIAGDVALWASLFASWQLGKMHVADAAEIANRWAGASLSSHSDAALLEAIGAYRSRQAVAGRRDSYDEAMLSAGKAVDSRFPATAAYDWDWGSVENSTSNAHMKQYQDALKSWRATKVALAFSAGGLVLSRVVAVADIIRLNRRAASRAGLQAICVPTPDGGAAILAVSF